MTDGERKLMIWAVLAVAATEPQRRAFIAGYNGELRPSPASDQMRLYHRRGGQIRAAILQEQSNG